MQSFQRPIRYILHSPAPQKAHPKDDMPQPRPALYPLRFAEILRNYTFGGRWIPAVFPAKQGLPADHRIAETWEVCDRGADSSVVTTGSLAGKTIHYLIEQYGEELLGTAIVARFGLRFPLLIKFLDATHELSEQAHHSDALAKKRGLADPGKTEAWYMLYVKPGAAIHCGNREGVTPESLFRAIFDGTSRQRMQERSVAPGDAFLLYAGTMHYAAGGVLFYEIMQNSDVYIGLKTDPLADSQAREHQAREAVEGVHLEDGFDALARPVCLAEKGVRRTFVLACEHFALERLDLDGEHELRLDGSKFLVLSQIGGESLVRAGGVEERLKPGHSCLIPASLGKVALVGGKGSSVLKAYVPDLIGDIVKPLRAAGISDEAIIGLGGRTRLNPLLELVKR
jgi:mannose-6-phosphate isomerase